MIMNRDNYIQNSIFFVKVFRKRLHCILFRTVRFLKLVMKGSNENRFNFLTFLTSYEKENKKIFFVTGYER